MYNVTIFGIHLKLKPIAFSIPIGSGWDIYWYGIIIAVGFMLAILYAYKNAKHFNLDIDRAIDVVLVTTPVAILCARAYYLIFDGEKLSSFSEFFGFGGSGFAGLAIYGGVIGAFVCGGIMCLIRKVKILDMFDLTALGFLIGQGVGRWGNFINQEAFGGPTGSSFFGMTSEAVVYNFEQNGYDATALAHPCFLYESIWCIVGFVIIHKLSKTRRFSGETLLMYGTWYGFGRTFIELLRTDSLMVGNIKISCLLSAVVCVFCFVTLLVVEKKVKENKIENYESVFGMEEETNTDEIQEEQVLEEATTEKGLENQAKEEREESSDVQDN